MMQPPCGHLKSNTSADFAECVMVICDETRDTFDQNVEADTMNVFLIILHCSLHWPLCVWWGECVCLNKKELDDKISVSKRQNGSEEK